MAALSGGAGLIGGLAGLFGGNNASSVQSPSMFQLPGQQAAGMNAFATTQALQNTFGALGQSTLPYAQNIFSSLYGNPYAGMMQGGAGTAAGLGESGALASFGLGSNLAGAGASMLPGAQAIMNTAFDPQQQLYAQTQGANNQQNLAALGQSGLANSPYGQSVLSNSNNNFNIGWQNNQLQREATGAGAAGNLLNQAGGAIGAGTGMMNAAPGQYLTAASMPYGTFSTIGGGQQSALNNLMQSYGGAQGLDTASLQNWLAYLGAGNASNATANNLFQSQLNQNQLATNQSLLFGQGLGTGLAALGKANPSNSPLLGMFNSNPNAWGGYNVTGL